jgi:DNA (cytosine-5)-methyltransferase 1
VPLAVDLFAGAGGATQGLRDAGFKVIAAVESDADAGATYRLNHHDTAVFEQDIAEVSPLDLVEGAGVDSVTLLNACPPCQGFSTLGTGDDDDPRNELISDVWRFMSALRPRAVVLENVPGIRRDQRLAHLLRQARGAGYAARGYTLDAADFGVPQRRRRHFVIAIRRPSRPLPGSITELFAAELPARERPVQGVFDVSAKLNSRSDAHHIARKLRDSTAQRVRAIPPGGSRFDLPDDQVLVCHAKLEQRHATGPYGRMKAGEPAPTLTTRCTTVSCGSFIHPTEHRGITLREAALIQTFPLGYRFEGGYDSIERQIGNALPVRLAAYVGRAVRAML